VGHLIYDTGRRNHTVTVQGLNKLNSWHFEPILHLVFTCLLTIQYENFWHSVTSNWGSNYGSTETAYRTNCQTTAETYCVYTCTNVVTGCPVHLPVVSTYTTKCCNTMQVHKVCKILKLAQPCSSEFSPGIWRCDIGCVVPNVLKAIQSLKCHDPLSEPPSVTSQKTWSLTLLSSLNETFLTSQVVLSSNYRMSTKEIGRQYRSLQPSFKTLSFHFPEVVGVAAS